MLRALGTVLVIITLALPACAVYQAKEPVTTLKADPRHVVEAGAVTPVDGITSSGQPSAEALAVYADSGYVAVIDLRTEKESRGFDEKVVVEGLGMDYVSLPIKGKDGISFENAEELEKVISRYSEPVLVHCGSGNRVGALLALGHIDDGMDQEAAIDLGKSAGLSSLENKVRETIEKD